MMSENKMCEWSKYLQKTSSFSFMTCTSVFNQRCMPLGLKKNRVAQGAPGNPDI